MPFLNSSEMYDIQLYCHIIVNAKKEIRMSMEDSRLRCAELGRYLNSPLNCMGSNEARLRVAARERVADAGANLRRPLAQVHSKASANEGRRKLGRSQMQFPVMNATVSPRNAVSNAHPTQNDNA
jgi:hypothetical protein